MLALIVEMQLRLELKTLYYTTILPDNRKEKSSQDFAPIDSNKVGIYFSPVDVWMKI